MNTKNFLIAGLVGGVLISILTNVPFISLVNCLLCAGFWGGALFAVWLYRRMTGTLTVAQGVYVGLLAGLVAGVLGFILGFLGWAGMDSLVNAVRPFIPAEDLPDMTVVEGALRVGFNLIGVLFTIAFGALGGLIGGLIFKEPK